MSLLPILAVGALSNADAPVDTGHVMLSKFQILAVVVLGSLLIRDLRRWSQETTGLLVRVLRCLVWVGAGVAIVDPDLVQWAAVQLGITRGADLVLYLFVLAFLVVSFFLYTRCLRLEREITVLTRHLAIRDAAHGPLRATQDPEEAPLT